MNTSMFIGRALCEPQEDDFDLTPFEERLIASPSWQKDWQANTPEMTAEDAARDSLQWAMDHTRWHDRMAACDELCEAYEADDRKARREAA